MSALFHQFRRMVCQVTRSLAVATCLLALGELSGDDTGVEDRRPPPPALPGETDPVLPPPLKFDPTQVILPAGSLDAVRDKTRGIRDEERDTYYALLAHARDVSLKDQQAAARGVLAEAVAEFRGDPRNSRREFRLFYDMVIHPDQYRGKPVTLHGYIQKLDAMEAGENDHGLQKLYQVYLFTKDSDGNPYVVVCSEIPAGLPIPRKGNATNDISVTGYFYKLWSYEAQRGNWGAPLILAGRLEWKPPPDRSLSTQVKAAITLGLAIAAVAGAFYLRHRAAEHRRFRERHTDLIAPPDNPG